MDREYSRLVRLALDELEARAWSKRRQSVLTHLSANNPLMIGKAKKERRTTGWIRWQLAPGALERDVPEDEGMLIDSEARAHPGSHSLQISEFVLPSLFLVAVMNRVQPPELLLLFQKIPWCSSIPFVLM